MSDRSNVKVPHDKLIEIIRELGLDEGIIPYFAQSKRTYAMRNCPFLRSVGQKFEVSEETTDLAFDLAIQRGWVIKDEGQ